VRSVAECYERAVGVGLLDQLGGRLQQYDVAVDPASAIGR